MDIGSNSSSNSASPIALPFLFLSSSSSYIKIYTYRRASVYIASSSLLLLLSAEAQEEEGEEDLHFCVARPFGMLMNSLSLSQSPSASSFRSQQTRVDTQQQQHNNPTYGDCRASSLPPSLPPFSLHCTAASGGWQRRRHYKTDIENVRSFHRSSSTGGSGIEKKKKKRLAFVVQCAIAYRKKKKN